MAHWLWLSSTAWLKVPSSSRSREDPIERGKLRSVNLLQRTRARPDSIHVWADRGRDHPEEFISQPHRWPYFFHHNGPVSHRHRHSPTASASRSTVLTRLNTWPARSPINASTPPSRAAPHDSGRSGSLAHIRMTFSFTTPRRFNRRTGEQTMTSKSTETEPSIVFCHGLWADGSCFSKVIPALQAEGHQVIAAQYGLNTTAEDVANVKSALGRVSSPAILVGHSYGESVITGAGTDDRVAGLVYICALAPDADETSQTQQSKFPRTDVFSHIEVVDGRIWLRPEGTKYFCGDLSEQEQKLVWATQGVPKPDLFEAKVGGTAWKSKPSWYIVGKKDRTVHPDLERAMAKRMGATTYELDSSHVPMLSQPERVLEVIRAAAKAVQAGPAINGVQAPGR